MNERQQTLLHYAQRFYTECEAPSDDDWESVFTYLITGDLEALMKFVEGPPVTVPFAWLAINEAIDKDGFYLQDGPRLRGLEADALKALGAPDTEEIVFLSVQPEDRDSAMVEARVTPAFAAWARQHQETGQECSQDENGNSNLVFYLPTEEA